MKKGILFLALILMAGVGCSKKKGVKTSAVPVYNPAAPYQHADTTTTTPVST